MSSSSQGQKRRQEEVDVRIRASAREAPLPCLFWSWVQWRQRHISLLISAASLQDLEAVKYQGILEEKGRKALTKEWGISLRKSIKKNRLLAVRAWKACLTGFRWGRGEKSISSCHGWMEQNGKYSKSQASCLGRGDLHWARGLSVAKLSVRAKGLTKQVNHNEGLTERESL